jgi:hypothetical protein
MDALAVALVALGDGLCLHTAVGGEGAADVVHLLELALRLAAGVALVAAVRLDQFSFGSHGCLLWISRETGSCGEGSLRSGGEPGC